MGPKAKPEPRVLSREDLLKCMPADEADLLLADALAESRGEHVPYVEMTVDELEAWEQSGESAEDLFKRAAK